MKPKKKKVKMKSIPKRPKKKPEEIRAEEIQKVFDLLIYNA